MNEELRARAIEAAAKVYGLPPYPSTWDLLDDETKESTRNLSTVFVDAVLSVVADWCDERDAELIVGTAVAESSGHYWHCRGASDEVRRVAGACRPVGEDQT